MSMPNDLIFVRHGESEGNVASKAAWQGDLSYHTTEFTATPGHRWRLTETGRAQAELMGKFIAAEISPNFDRYYVSPYVRTRETAARLGLDGASWQINRSIRERDSGDMDAQPEPQARKRQEYELNNLSRLINPLYSAKPNGESIAGVSEDRVRSLLGTLYRKCPGQKVIAVTHGNFMWAARLLLESLTDEQWVAAWNDNNDQVHNCEVFHYTRLDPATGLQGKTFTHRRRARPVRGEVEIDDWVKLTAPRFTNEQLLLGLDEAAGPDTHVTT